MDVAAAASVRNDAGMKRWVIFVALCLALAVIVGFAATRPSEEPQAPITTVAPEQIA